MSRRRPNPLDGQHSLPSLFDELRNDYTATKTNRFQRTRTGLPSIDAGADYHFRTDAQYYRLIELARDLERNDTVISQGLRRLVANIVQQGFTLDANTGDEKLDAELQSMWVEWASDRDQVTMSQEFSFSQLEHMLLYQVLVDGDIIPILTGGGAIDIAEAHRLRTPRTAKNVVLGVMLDEHRRRKEYWFTRQNIDPRRSSSTLRVRDMRRIAARDAHGHRQVLHLYNPSRITQTRGVTAYQPIIPMAGMLDDVQFARLVQQQAVSAWCILRERGESFTRTRTSDDEENITGATLPSTLSGSLSGIAAGMEVVSENGEKITGFSPNVPNTTFFDHTNLLLTIIAVNLDQPVAMFMLDPTQTNFSGWRGAMDQARMRFRSIQQWYSTTFHREVYPWKLREWIAGDAALKKSAERTGISIFKHLWHPPRWPYIEPLKDASADLLRDRNGLTSKRRLHAERGAEWQTIAREIVEDNSLAIVLAKQEAERINQKFGDDHVHWRELISLPTPDGIQIALTPQGEERPNEPARNPNQ